MKVNDLRPVPRLPEKRVTDLRLEVEHQLGITRQQADELAGRWAKKRGHHFEVFVAEWAREGRAAGPLRNQRMLDTKPDGVVGLPGGTGTAHMCRIAEEAGVKVWRPYG